MTFVCLYLTFNQCILNRIGRKLAVLSLNTKQLNMWMVRFVTFVHKYLWHGTPGCNFWGVQLLIIAVPCLSAIWVLRQGTGWRPPIAGCKIQMGPQRQNLTNLDPVFCKKWVSIWIRGMTFFLGTHIHFFGRQNGPFFWASSLFITETQISIQRSYSWATN